MNEVQTVGPLQLVQLSCHTEIGLGTRFTKCMSFESDEILVRRGNLAHQKSARMIS